MTEEIGLTCRPRRLQAAKPDRSEHVFNEELRGLEPLPNSLETACDLLKGISTMTRNNVKLPGKTGSFVDAVNRH